MRTADIGAHHPDRVAAGKEKFQKMKNISKDILDKKEPYIADHLVINGNDLSDLGFKPGPIFDFLYTQLMDIVYQHPEKNDKEVLTTWLLNNKSRLEKTFLKQTLSQ